ncbi:MAG: GTPase [Nocardioidaceae bacterium]
MTSLVEGAKRLVGRGSDVTDRIDGLAEAARSARGRLDDSLVDEASAVAERAGDRLRLSGEHTVVALAGATGSGKSSTFNAVTGLELAAIGVRRPTTSWTMACAWGADGAPELLDWLGVPKRHQVMRDSMLDEPREDRGLNGLVLLDLPDHDSTEVAHHVEVDRLVKLADLLVWVLDPQKYADAAIHDRFLRPLASHKDVMIVVLNHIDEVPQGGRGAMLDDVRRLLELDGLGGVPVLGTSAKTGEGIPELRGVIAKRVADKATIRKRLGGDVSDSATRMHEHSGDAKPRELANKDRVELVEALTDAAGVPIVVEAVRRASSVRARRATGWPMTAWLSRLKPDPLRRLHLDRGKAGNDPIASARSSLPRTMHIHQARVETTVRDLCDGVSDGLAPPWVRAVRHASTSRFVDVTDRLDRAVTSTDLGVSATPLWCRGVRVLQWMLLLSALVGALWLGVLAGAAYLQLPPPRTPDYQGFPVPSLMLVLGVFAGIALAALSRVLISIAAKSHARKAETQLRAAVADVAEELVIAPVVLELVAYRRTWEGLRKARR